jgi:hypothetical protein
MGRFWMYRVQFDQQQQLGKVGSAHEKIRKILSDHIGYVLVTCRPIKKSGKMEVEVSYEGDPDLASYLVDGAQGYLESEHENEQPNES